jgi:hypothetical protein
MSASPSSKQSQASSNKSVLEHDDNSYGLGITHDDTTLRVTVRNA